MVPVILLLLVVLQGSEKFDAAVQQTVGVGIITGPSWWGRSPVELHFIEAAS